MEAERLMIHIRLPKTLIKRLDHMAVDAELDRGRMAEKLLELALDAKEQEAQL